MLPGFHALVHAVLPDGGQHLTGDPVLERLGLRHLAAQDQAVQPGLVDDEHFLLAGGGVVFHDILIFGVNVTSDSIPRIFVSQSHGNILADQPRLAVDLDGAHLPELGVGENL